MSLRIGDVLVLAGVLSEFERDRIVEAQQAQGKPFGLLAEELFGVEPKRIELAWAEQYAQIVGDFDVRREMIDPEVVRVVSPRQAWQFRVLPIRREADGLILCTTRCDLPRALRFATTHLSEPVQLVVADPVSLGEALVRLCPMAGLDADQLASGFATLAPRSAS